MEIDKIIDILKLLWCIPVGLSFSTLEYGCLFCIFHRKCPFEGARRNGA